LYKFNPTGEIKTWYKAALMVGHVYADDGTPIKAYFNLNSSEAPEYNTDCHGLTFTNGDYWIDNTEVDKILKGDGYKKVDDTRESKSSTSLSKAKVGDVVIYRDANGNILHSATVEEVNIKSFLFFTWIDIKVNTLSGTETEPYKANITDAPDPYVRYSYIQIYRKEERNE
jgi:hypothetical protein